MVTAEQRCLWRLFVFVSISCSELWIGDSYLLDQHRDILQLVSSIQLVPPVVPLYRRTLRRHLTRLTIFIFFTDPRQIPLRPSPPAFIRTLYLRLSLGLRPLLARASLEESRTLREDESMEHVVLLLTINAHDNLHIPTVRKIRKLVLRRV